MIYFVQWAATPTSYNTTQLTELEDMRNELVKVGRGIEWASHRKAMMGIEGHVIFKVYSETSAERHVYYEHQGYNAPYISPDIDTLIGPALVEVRK